MRKAKRSRPAVRAARPALCRLARCGAAGAEWMRRLPPLRTEREIGGAAAINRQRVRNRTVNKERYESESWSCIRPFDFKRNLNVKTPLRPPVAAGRRGGETVSVRGAVQAKRRRYRNETHDNPGSSRGDWQAVSPSVPKRQLKSSGGMPTAERWASASTRSPTTSIARRASTRSIAHLQGQLQRDDDGGHCRFPGWQEAAAYPAGFRGRHGDHDGRRRAPSSRSTR